jgi:hypothetical protein
MAPRERELFAEGLPEKEHSSRDKGPIPLKWTYGAAGSRALSKVQLHRAPRFPRPVQRDKEERLHGLIS